MKNIDNRVIGNLVIEGFNCKIANYLIINLFLVLPADRPASRVAQE